MKLRLRIVPAQGEPFESIFDGESLVIGRSSEADLVLADRFLSRHHSRLFRDDGAVWLEDLGSRNGTLLNNRRVGAPQKLKPGDVIKISGSLVYIQDAMSSAVFAEVESENPFSGEGTILLNASELLDKQEPTDTRHLRDEAALRRYAERLKILNEVHKALGASHELENLLELIFDRVFDHLRPEQGAIFLKRDGDPNGDSGELELAASRSQSGIQAPDPASRSLAHEVVEKGMAALVTDITTDERFAAAQSMVGAGIRSLVAAPLLAPEGSLGMIVLSSQLAVRRFSEGDLELLVSLASVAALGLRNVKLTEEAVERRRLEKELALGRRIQQALLPERLPEIDGFSLYAANIPSRGVSGDYYQVLARPEHGDFVLMIADVSGKGVGASLLTASLEALATGPIEDGLGPDVICSRLTRQLGQRTPPEKYATALLAMVDLEGRVRFTNAGHNPGLVLRGSGEVERLQPNGMPLGLVPEKRDYGLGETVLGHGDVLLLYTDGLTEASDPDGEEYGLERLEAVSRAACAESSSAVSPCAVSPSAVSPSEIAARISEDLESFARGVPFGDDRTLVVVRRA